MQAARIAGALLIVFSLVVKLRGDYAVPFDDSGMALRTLASRMAADGYTVNLEIGQRNRVTALRGPCRMVLRLLDPHGTTHANTARTLAKEGRVGYIWRGEWRDDLPRFGPLMNYYFKRELTRQGISASRQPVWIAALGKGCEPLPDARFADIAVTLLRAGE